jgi:opacity protein-like surface antigen
MLGLLCSFALPTLARADVFGHDPAFAQGTWTLQTTFAYAEGLENRDEEIKTGSVGVGYFVLNDLSFNLELEGLAATQDGDDGAGGGFSISLHHYLAHVDRFALYADVGFGPVDFDEHVPAAGTRWDYIFRAGFGVDYQLTEKLYLVGGVRYFHLSNAELEGRDRNPSINGPEGFVGLMFRL